MKIHSREEYSILLNQVRGTVLTACINLEIIIDLYIAEKICDTKDKINEMTSLILTPRVSLREKLEIFKVLIAKYNPEFKDKKGNFYNDLKNIIEHRNVFAHLPASVSDEGLDEYNNKGNFMFYKFKNFTDEATKEIGYSRVPIYTNDSIDEILSACNTYITL